MYLKFKYAYFNRQQLVIGKSYMEINLYWKGKLRHASALYKYDKILCDTIIRSFLRSSVVLEFVFKNLSYLKYTKNNYTWT